jgi:hypothetical protein
MVIFTNHHFTDIKDAMAVPNAQQVIVPNRALWAPATPINISTKKVRVYVRTGTYVGR